MEKELQWKTKPLMEERPPMEDDIYWKTTSKGRRHIMEDDLKKLKVKYLGNQVLLKLLI
jgi:hypothetical protein